MKMNVKTLWAALPALICAAFFAGCTTYDNNYLRPEDFACRLPVFVRPDYHHRRPEYFLLLFLFTHSVQV